MKSFKSNKVLNAALGKVSGDAFRVLYFIIGNLKLHNTNRAEIARVSIAVRLGLWDDESGRKLKKQLDKITKYTDELEEKGFLVKDVIFDGSTGKRKTIYAVPDAFFEQKVNTDMQKLNENVPKKGVTKQYNKYNNSTYTTATTNTTEHYNATSTTEAAEHNDAAEVEDENLEELFGSCLIDPKDYEDNTEETAYLQDLNKRIVYARWDSESSESSSKHSSDNLPF